MELNNEWGISTHVDIKGCDPELIKSKAHIQDYVIQLCKLIEMNRYGDVQIVHFGEDENVAGYSMIQLIETSLISGHFANALNAAYIDIFSCKGYDSQLVGEFTRDFFKAKDLRYQILHRR